MKFITSLINKLWPHKHTWDADEKYQIRCLTETTTLIIPLDLAYPFSAPQGFLTLENVCLSSGGRPRYIDFNTHDTRVPKEFQYWFIHPQRWNPNHDTLITFLNIIRIRLQKCY